MLFLICQPFKSLAIIKLCALSLLQKTVLNRDQLFLYTDPRTVCFFIFPLFFREEMSKIDMGLLCIALILR
jgi:hypothetical protein